MFLRPTIQQKYSLFLLVAGFISLLKAEPVSLSGQVTEKGAPLADVTVTLKHGGLNGLTDPSGHFQIIGDISVERNQQALTPYVKLRGNSVEMLLIKGQKVRVSAYDISGRCLEKVFSGFIQPGNYSFYLPAIANQIALVRVITEDKKYSFIHNSLLSGTFLSQKGSSKNPYSVKRLAKTAAVADTLVFSKLGYPSVFFPLSSNIQSNINITMDILTTPFLAYDFYRVFYPGYLDSSDYTVPQVRDTQEIYLSIGLLNAGGGPALSVQTTLVTNDPMINIIYSTTNYNNIISRAVVENLSNSPFAIQISPDMPAGHAAKMYLNIRDAWAGTWIDSFFLVAKPFSLAASVLDDDNTGSSQGNSNHVAETGETLEYTPQIKNNSGYSVGQLEVSLLSTKAGFLLDSSAQTFPFPDLGPGVSNISAQGDYIFSVANFAPNNDSTERFDLLIKGVMTKGQSYWVMPVRMRVTPSYRVTVVPDSTLHGSVQFQSPFTNGGIYFENSTITVRAVPYQYYVFNGWTGNLAGSIGRTDSSALSFNVLGKTDIIAHFLDTVSAPIITSNPLSQTVNAGQSLTLSVGALGRAVLSYQWKKNGTNITGATSSQYIINPVLAADSGRYTVVVSNGLGSDTSDVVSLTVYFAPSIVTQPQSRTVTAGQSVTFTVTAAGNPTVYYLWKKNGVNTSITTSSYTINPVQESDTGTYTVTVTNSLGSVNSNSAALTVYFAPSIVTQPQSRGVAVGQSATFSIVARGNPSPTFQWKKGGVNISGATSATYTKSSVQTSDTGSYTVVVTNSQGSVTSDEAILKIIRFPLLVSISAGTFQMGDSTYAPPIHQVSVSAFSMSSTEVTQELYEAAMGINPTLFDTGSTWPVEMVTWFDAVLFCNALSKAAGKDTVYSYTSVSGSPGNGCLDLGGIAYDTSKNGYRLPTEAEWEYACRAGTTTAWYWSDTWDATAEQYSWNSQNSSNITHGVGTKTANAWGLYDMAGNVWEWTNDWYVAYGSVAQTDPTGPTGGSIRVLRGGGYSYSGDALRSACRGSDLPSSRNNYYGFRVACRP